MIVGYVSDERYIALHDVSVLFEAEGSEPGAARSPTAARFCTSAKTTPRAGCCLPAANRRPNSRRASRARGSPASTPLSISGPTTAS